ncbi:MAG: DUF1501 domain-containing protein [Litoreibacter sp.]|nr:DUF1501 domain-containing protein [Litoreibacter sp.]MCY4334594.1 DUF1501 domain-containing protein [Litoreibacter sp.]
MQRRRFLTGLGCSLAASPFVTPVSFAATGGEKRLVVIILRGGMDGMDALRPTGDPLFAQYRPRLAAERGLPLDGFYELHPALSDLMPLWKAGDLAFAPAVSTPYRDKRSHFDGQDLLEAGTGMDVTLPRDGWLNRLLQVMPGATSETAFSVGREDMRLLSGSAPVSSWSPEARLDMSPQARLLLQEVYHGDALFREAGEEAVLIADSLGVSSDDSFGMSKSEMREARTRAVQGSQAEVLARFAAARLNEHARIAAFSLPGWDTHRGQRAAMSRALGGLQGAVLTLKSELGANWGQTAVVAMTEFGRTARENGSVGTDHGTGGAMLLAGGAINGGRVFGDWPGLEEAVLYARRDLMPVTDVRAYPAWLMQGLFGVNQSALELSIFPGLKLQRDPGVLL